VDRDEIQNLAAYIKVFDAYAKSMQRAGATQSEIRAAMGELLTPKLRAYLLVRGIVEVERRRSRGLSTEADGSESNITGPCDKTKPSPHVERRVMHLAPGGGWTTQQAHWRPRRAIAIFPGPAAPGFLRVLFC
jgi:hypothetical protein